MRRYILRMAVTTAVFGTLFGLVFDNPRWYLNIPLGLAVGAVVGVGLWKPHQALHAWLDRREQCVWREREMRRDHS